MRLLLVAVAVTFMGLAPLGCSSRGARGEAGAATRPRASTSPPLVLAPDQCSGPGTCREALAALLAACPAQCDISLQPGVYRWNTSAGPIAVANTPIQQLRLHGLSAAAPAVISTFGRALGGILSIDGVPTLTLANLTLSAERLPYTFGLVLSVSSSELLVAVNTTQYPLNKDILKKHDNSFPWTAEASNIYGAIDPATGNPVQPMYWGGGGPMSIVRNATAGNATAVVRVAHRNFPAALTGHYVVLEHSRSHTAIDIANASRQVDVRHVRLHSNPGFGFLFTASHNIAIDQTEIVPPPGLPPAAAPMSIMADGLHFTLCTGYLRITRSRVVANGDDCFAFNNHYNSVAGTRPGPDSKAGACVVVNTDRGFNPVPGLYRFRSRHTLQAIGGVLRLVAAQQHLPTLCFDQPVPAGVQPADVVTSLAAPDEVLIRDSAFLDNLGHGIRIKNPNTLLDNVTVGGNSFMPLLFIPDASFWMSSLVVTNATVRNSAIRRGGVWADAQYDALATAAATITAYVPASWKGSQPSGSAPLSTGQVNADILFQNNTIDCGSVPTAFLARATANLTLAGNRVVWDSGPAGWGQSVPVLLHTYNSVGVSAPPAANVCAFANGTSFPCRVVEDNDGH